MSVPDTGKHHNALAMSIREAAEKLGVSQALLWKLIRKGDVAVVRLGGRTLVAADELRRLLTSAA